MKSWKRTLAPSPARLQTSASHTSFISSVEDSSICMTGLRYEDAKLTSHIELGYLVLTVRMGSVIVCEIFRHLQLWCQLLRTKMLILRSVANLTALSSILFWHFSYFSYESVVFNLIHLTIKKSTVPAFFRGNVQGKSMWLSWMNTFLVCVVLNISSARFIQAVSEMEFLGFIKSTKQKTDHVARLTWGGC